MRAGLNKGLGFSPEDRKENIRRTAETAVLMADAGLIALCSLVSPTIEDRLNAREIAKGKNLKFFEVFVDTPIEECKRRDTKGLYERASKGEIKGKSQSLYTLLKVCLLYIFCGGQNIKIIETHISLSGLTGMDPKAPYEKPQHPELTLDTVKSSIDETVNCVIGFLTKEVRTGHF